MNKQYLISEMRSTGACYAFYFLFGCHYLYMGRVGLQFLFWFTWGGLGVWAFLDLFLIPSKVQSHNMKLSKEIERIEWTHHQHTIERTIKANYTQS